METLIHKARNSGKAVVIAGCVSQASSDHPSLKGVSIVGVQQIHRILEVVEETFRGNEVRLLKRANLPALDLPKVIHTSSILMWSISHCLQEIS